jgi:paraquat-inducible protein B
MTAMQPQEPDELPAPDIKPRRWLPRLVWLVPTAALVVGITLAVKSWENAGPQITISFLSGEGVQVGKTLVKYRDVAVGRVSAVSLSDDQRTVLVTADLSKDARKLITADSQFWIVRPRIGVGWASGLDTLLSGAYIGLNPGSSDTVAKRFQGLENPPALAHGADGKRIELQAVHARSLATGSPVYFRRFPVGRIIDQTLLADGNTRVSVFIDAPYDRFVTPRSRFWNASGVNLSLGADGLNVQTESIASVLAGGLAFDDGPEAVVSLTLYQNETEAMAPPDGEPRYVRMRFAQGLRGLEVGAPVEFVGVNIGSVIAVDLGYEPKTRSFPLIVTARLYVRRMGQAYAALAAQGATESDATMATFVGSLVGRGLRAQPRSGSLLTGKLYIALDFLPAVKPVSFDAALRPLEFPTVNGTFQDLEIGVAKLVKKMDDLPLQRTVQDLDRDLNDLHASLTALNGQVLPEAGATLSALRSTVDSAGRVLKVDSPLQQSLIDSLAESRATLESLRDLATYLELHPDSLVRGRRPQAVPKP